MKILKYLFFLLLIFIIAGAIYVATKDGKYQIEETTLIEAPIEVVYNEVNNLRNWEDWGPWMESKDVIINYKEKSKGEGSSYTWNSETIGQGAISITKSTPFTTIEQELSVESNNGKTQSDMYWSFEDVENGTMVTWGMKGNQSFMEKLKYTFKDSSYTEMVKPAFIKGLDNLNEIILKKMDAHSINIDGVTQFGGGYYMYTTTASKISQIQNKMEKMLTEVSLYMEDNNISQNGKPFVLYNKWDENNNTAIYSTGIFTPSLVITPSESNVLNGMMPNQKVLKTTLKGDYKYLKNAWNQAYQYLNTKGLDPAEESQAFEIYKIGPQDSPNPADWITEIYIPLKEEPANNLMEY